MQKPPKCLSSHFSGYVPGVGLWGSGRRSTERSLKILNLKRRIIKTSFLFQRLSVCIQRFNLVAFKGTFLTTEDLPDIIIVIITIIPPEGSYLPRVKKNKKISYKKI